jgi:hypothetical protein
MKSISDQRNEQFAQFLNWVKQHIKGDEKGEAHLFLDRLFQAFGHLGLKEAGGVLEMRVKHDDGGTAFADFVWKPVVLVEMKKRGTNLQSFYRQAFDYWTRLVPGRPRYVVLCNFDEFWVYDFETQMDTPVDKLKLADLPERYGPLAFLFPIFEKPNFGNDQQAVTREAANLLALCFNSLIQRAVPQELSQRFILQMLVALFSEDIGLLKKYLVAQLLDECKEPQDSFDLIGGLFIQMNSPGQATGGRFKGVDYFNGGLFSNPARLELESDEIHFLKEAAKADWSQVRPEIFGTLFEHSLGKKERHAFGAHFTSPSDIMKIIGPTIVEPWRDQIENAKTLKRLLELQSKMITYTVLDPACGSGNFLYIAYREMKRLEFRINERITLLSSKQTEGQTALGLLTANQFYGMDVNPFAVELAKVTMVIARKLAIDELHITEHALPLDNLDQNFIAGDALLNPDGYQAPWPKVDVIIGNPPFLSSKKLKPERGPDYVKSLRKAYAKVPGMADYCVYWFRKAHDELEECTLEDPCTGRAGLVGTQNVRNNQSRVGGLDHIVKTGTILEAVDNQPWSGEANVNVSIVNWVKSKDPKLLTKKRVLWSQIKPPNTKQKKPRNWELGRTYELERRECLHIGPAITDKIDVTGAIDLQCNLVPQRSFNGQMLGHSAFLLTEEQRKIILSKDPVSSSVIYPYLNGKEFLTGSGKPRRYVLDFRKMDQIQAAQYKGAFDWVRSHVLPDRQRKADEGKDKSGKQRSHHKGFLARWWQLSFGRPELITAIESSPRYLCCSLVTKRPIFVFVHSSIRPSNLLQIFTFDDDYSFGILQSSLHWLWFMEKSSKLRGDFRFGESVWNTFPWPQDPNSSHIDAVAKAARAVREIRAEALSKVKGGLRAVYQILDLPGAHPLKDAHTCLDDAVRITYGFSQADDPLSRLLQLNQDIARRIEEKQDVTKPGIPTTYPTPSRLLSTDCISP